MGQAIAASLDKQDDMELAGLWGRGDDLASLVEAADGEAFLDALKRLEGD